jgi:hypothetical protein
VITWLPPPVHIIAAVGFTVTVGSAFTLTMDVAVAVQPAPGLVPVTVYVVATVGLAVGFAIVDDDKPVAGDHE